MSDIFGWLLSVVVVGIAINIASHYVQKKIDKQLSTLSSRWRKYSDEKKVKRIIEIEKLRDNPDEQIHLAFAEMRFRFYVILFGFLLVMFLNILLISRIASAIEPLLEIEGISISELSKDNLVIPAFFSVVIVVLMFALHQIAEKYFKLIVAARTLPEPDKSSLENED